MTRKAFLLAAGLGTRLKPLTERIPKCLVPIHGKPLLSIWLEICDRLEVREVLINTHYLPDQVRAWALSQDSRVRINLAHEEVLLGSAGTVAANRDFVRNDEDFYIFYADNLVCANLAALGSFHARHAGLLTVGLFRPSRPRDCGVVTLSEDGLITSFEEKPSEPKSDLASAGIFLARQALFDWLPGAGFADLGKHVMPRLLGAMAGLHLEGYILDIGTPENYQKALKEWPAIADSIDANKVSGN